MNKKCLTTLVAMGLIICGDSLYAEGLSWSGYLQTDNRLCLKGNNEYSWQENRLDLQSEVKPDEKTRFYSEIWLRSWGVPFVQSTQDLSDKDKVSPWGLDIREAYADLYGFVFKTIDLRVGRQRISWGTGDKINPTDNLNPYDLEDLWDFGRHLGSDALKLTWYEGNYTLTGVFIPTFTPAVLPQGDYVSVLFNSKPLPAGLNIGNTTSSVILPKDNLENSTIGIKIAKKLFNYDFSLSYMHGIDGLPVVTSVALAPATTIGTVDISNSLTYPKMNIIGMDLAGSVSNIGIWAEAALFYPEKLFMTTDLSALGMGTETSIALNDTPYLKYVLGTDYSFKNNIYINGQFVHGMFFERGNNGLEDYLMGGLEWKNSDETIKLTPIAVCAEIKDINDIANNYALVFSPEISYYPVNTELTVGIRLINGKDTTTFGKLTGKDEVYLKIKYSF